MEELGLKYLSLVYEETGDIERAEQIWQELKDMYDDSPIKNSYYLFAYDKLAN